MATRNEGDAPPPPPYHRRGSNQDLQVPMTDVQRMSMEDEDRPLPEGWIRQFDAASAHHFYVDTKATPPRSIWVHPEDDEQFQREHGITPHRREGSTSPVPPPSPGRKLHKGEGKDVPSSPTRAGAAPPSPSADGPSGQHKDRGFFGKLKDKTIGTKEEREAAKKRRAAEEREMQKRYLERRRILLEQQRAQDAALQQYYARNGPLGGAGYRYGSNYAPPPMAFGRSPYGGYGGGGYGYGGRGGFGGGGFGGGGLGLPLLAGLGGGILGAELASDFGGGGYGGGFDGGGGGFDAGGGGFDGGGGF